MKVELLNREAVENIYKTHGVFACECYGTDASQAERVGKACAESGHMSGSRTIYINFRISDIDRGTAEQIMRHEIGVRIPQECQDNYTFSEAAEMYVDANPNSIVKNMASFRYLDKGEFEYYLPEEIAEIPRACKAYITLMEGIKTVRQGIYCDLINNGHKQQKANELANFVLPRATGTSLTVGFTPEALIHFMHKRLCTRAQEPIRNVAKAMKEIIKEINPTLALEFVPHCEWLLWCPEKRGCGKMKGRTETIERLKR